VSLSLPLHDLVAGIGVGLIGGVTSGLLGVSPGGGLVVSSILLLGAEQHVAQGISLAAQIPPAGLSGIRRYWEKGRRTPPSWLILLTIGFLVGGVGGAAAAAKVSGVGLRWTYVLYLTALDALLIFRPPHARAAATSEGLAGRIRWTALLGVGAVAGFSSGFLGIGGGLAITAGLAAGLRVPQHQAQLVSLVFSIIPTTIPAVWVYRHEGWSASWLVIGGVVLGLWVGTDIGARLANRLDETNLHRILFGFVSAMALYMAWQAVANPG
jgi:uncharacterized membrane protein YfcA